ncbi:hypothetical protein ACE6H2_013862 [Prunus campanulata]
MDRDYLFLTLFNPFTGRSIRLPPFKESTQVALHFHCDGEFHIQKVVLFADPCLFPNDFEALIQYYEGDPISYVAHFKAGDNTWTHIAIWKSNLLLSDAIDHKVTASMTGTGATRPPAIPPSKYYLFKSSQGDLLLVEDSYNRCSVDKMLIILNHR